jgi:hypothetical protein
MTQDPKALQQGLAFARKFWLKVFYRVTRFNVDACDSELDRHLEETLNEHSAATSNAKAVRTGKKDLTDTQLAALSKCLGGKARFHPADIMGQNWREHLEEFLLELAARYEERRGCRK